MTYHRSSASSKASSTSSSTSVASSISSLRIVLRYLIILRGIILWLCVIVLWLHNVILILRSVIWGWYLVKLWCIFPCHHLLPAPYRCLMFFPSSAPSSYSLCHHGPLTCKICSMNSWVLSDISASLDNDMDHVHVFYRSHTIVLLSTKGLVIMFPCTACESWAFILVMSFCPACGTPNNFSFVLTPILV
jgi:hypothetical protein